MNHRVIILAVSALIVASIIGGVVYVEWPTQPTSQVQPPTQTIPATPIVKAPTTATSSLSNSLPQPTIGTPVVEAQAALASANPTLIAVNEATDVTVTIELSDSRLIPASVNLQRLDASGKVTAVLGTLNDAGTNGDAVAGDKIFTLRQSLTEETTAAVQLRVSWGLRGVLKRAVSNVVSVEVGKGFTSADASFVYPTFGQDSQVDVTQREPEVKFIEVKNTSPEDQSLVTTFGILIEPNPERLSLEEWFDAHVDINGVLAQAGTFRAEDFPDGRRMIVLVGPVPADYEGIVEYAYVMSPTRDKVASIGLSDDHGLSLRGYTTVEQKKALLRSIVETLTFTE